MSESIFQNRHSKRKFHSDQLVSKETLESILKDAINAPSWGNTQSWEVYIAERMKANFQFFDAPAVAFLTLDASLTDWSMHDLGIFSRFFMLSIEAHGLGSLPAYTSVAYPKFQREILGIPNDKKIVAGIIFGYPVQEDKDSQVIMPRVALEEVVHF